MAAETGKEWKTRLVVAVILLVVLAYLVFNSLWSYANAFFISIFAYIILKPAYAQLRKFGIGKTASALLSMLIGAIVIGMPALVFFQLLLSEAMNLLTPASMQSYATAISQAVASLESYFPGIDVRGNLANYITQLIYQTANVITNVLLASAQDAGALALGALVAIFVTYYLLTSEEKAGELMGKIVPFNRKNRARLVDEFNRVTYSVLMSMGAMGLAQALPLMLVFIYYGVPGAAILGFLALLLTFIPFVGIPFVWIPVALMELLQGNQPAAIGITIVGILLAVVENWRPIMQKYFGQVHPLIALLGVIVGIANFGIVGVLVGPLILSYAILAVGMFREEYL